MPLIKLCKEIIIFFITYKKDAKAIDTLVLYLIFLLYGNVYPMFPYIWHNIETTFSSIPYTQTFLNYHFEL